MKNVRGGGLKIEGKTYKLENFAQQSGGRGGVRDWCTIQIVFHYRQIIKADVILNYCGNGQHHKLFVPWFKENTPKGSDTQGKYR